MDPIKDGDLVTYHGSITSHHGTYTVISTCECDRCVDTIDTIFEHLYLSTPVGRRGAIDLTPHRRYELVSPDGEHLLCVRRKSITPKEES